jgi:hypothetical protein
MTVSDRIRVKNVRVLSDNYATLKDTTFEWRRANGRWQTQTRETYDLGNLPRCSHIIWRSAAWCWCGSFVTPPMSTAATTC